jgi:phosphatidylinositol-3-phosphatase
MWLPLTLRPCHSFHAIVASAFLTIGTGPAQPATQLPHYDHIVLVVMENHSYNQLFASPRIPYLLQLRRESVVFTRSYGVAHPSQPNYLALFSGSTHGVKDDKKHDLMGDTLATQLTAAGKTFVGYAEAASPRKHNPWESFPNADSYGRPLTAMPADFNNLPDVAFAIPNLNNDMHDGSPARADRWLRTYMKPYVEWAKLHKSLFILTFDEDDYHSKNRILTLFDGAGLRRGMSSQRIDHFAVLRTIEQLQNVAPLNEATARSPITNVWHNN